MVANQRARKLFGFYDTDVISDYPVTSAPEFFGFDVGVGYADLGLDTDVSAADVVGVNDAPTATITPRDDVRSGVEIQVNTTRGGSQSYGAMAALPDGGYVTTWSHGPSQGGEVANIYSQRYDASGAPRGGELKVNTTASTTSQTHSSVAALSDGGYVVTWESYAVIYAQRFDSSGAAAGGEIGVLANTNNEQTFPVVTGLAGGGFVVAWDYSRRDGSGTAIIAQRYDGSGVAQGGQTQVNTFTANNQEGASIAALPDGGYVVTWTSWQQDGPGSGVYAQRYDGAGVRQGGEFLVNTSIANNQVGSAVTALRDGGFVIAWNSTHEAIHGPSSIYAQRCDASGVALGGEFRVSNFGGGAVITGLADGGFVVAWGLESDIYARRFNEDGVPLGPQKLVNTRTSGTQWLPSIAGLEDGDYVVGWSILNQGGADQHGVYNQRYTLGIAATEQQAIDLKGTMSVADADAGAGILSVTLSVTHGILTVSAGTSGAVVTNSETGSVTVTGTLAQINALLSTDGTSVLSYMSDSDVPPPTATLGLVVNDGGNSGGGALQGSDSQIITITPVNDRPILTLSAASPAYTENGAPVVIDGGITVSDIDGPIAVALVEISNSYVGGPDILTFVNSDATAFGNIAVETRSTGSLLYLRSAGETATFAQWENALRSVTYHNTSDNPTSLSRNVNFSLSDGTSSSAYATKYVTVTAVNDAPLIDLNGAAAGISATLAFREGNAITRITPSATVVDADSTNLATGTLTVELTSVGSGDFLSILSGNGIAVLDGNPAYINYNGTIIASYTASPTKYVFTFNAAATPAAVQALTRQVSFGNQNDNQVSGDRTVTFTLTDGDGGTSNTATATVSVTAVDDPAVANNDANAVAENGVITGASVFGNDSDADGDPFVVTASTARPRPSDGRSSSSRAPGSRCAPTALTTTTPMAASTR